MSKSVVSAMFFLLMVSLIGTSAADYPNGTVAVYCFGGGTEDLSGNGNNASLGGGASITGDGLLDFGSEGYLDVSSVAGTLAGGNWTVYLAQLKPATTNGQWICIGEDGEESAFSMHQNTEGQQFWTDVWFSHGGGFSTSVGSFADGTAREVFITYSGGFTVYVGTSSVGSGGISYSVPGSQAYIGKPPWPNMNGDWGKPSLGGTVAAVGIFNRVLSEAEMEELIDTICVRCAVSKANPGNGAVYVDPDADLSWTAGEGAVSHNVYFGTNEDDVTNGTGLAADIDGSGVVDMGDLAVLANWWLQNPAGSQPSPDLSTDGNVNFVDYAVVTDDWKAESVFKGNQVGTTYDPGALDLGQTYYWRIDEVNDVGGLCVGKVWIFTVDDGKAHDPDPKDGATNVGENVTLSWTPGIRATSHDVYLGTSQTAVANATKSSGEYKGNVTGNSLNVAGLELERDYFWRVDAVKGANVWKGNIWRFDTQQSFGPVNVIVYHNSGDFAGWPANNGLLWQWGDDELACGFELAEFCCKEGHNACGDHRNVIAKSTDGGMTWTMFDPSNYVGDDGGSSSSPGINFAHPDFAMRVTDDRYYVSYDRCRNWQGPYPINGFAETSGWDFTSRTDYIVNGPSDCMIGMSVNQDEFGTDRAFWIRTTDGGKTFQFQGWIVPKHDPYRGVMPSTVRCSPTKLVTAVRRRDMDEDCRAWVDCYASNDNGKTWHHLSRVGDTGCENGNPPGLARLSDGRLVCAYGNRSALRMFVRYSDNEGQSWGPQITLRDDLEDCEDDAQDLGYPRITELANGRIVCVYYWSTGSHIQNHIAGTIWR